MSYSSILQFALDNKASFAVSEEGTDDSPFKTRVKVDQDATFDRFVFAMVRENRRNQDESPHELRFNVRFEVYERQGTQLLHLGGFSGEHMIIDLNDQTMTPASLKPLRNQRNNGRSRNIITQDPIVSQTSRAAVKRAYSLYRQGHQSFDELIPVMRRVASESALEA